MKTEQIDSNTLNCSIASIYLNEAAMLLSKSMPEIASVIGKLTKWLNCQFKIDDSLESELKKISKEISNG